MSVKFSNCLWSHDSAKEMATYYSGVFPDFTLISENPLAVVYEMAGMRFMGLNNGMAHVSFNEKISFVLTVDTQAEIDHYWDYFAQEGVPGQCGWIQDKYGVSWQVVPSVLGKLMTNPVTAPKAAYAFMQMTKFDIAQLEAAVAQ